MALQKKITLRRHLRYNILVSYFLCSYTPTIIFLTKLNNYENEQFF